MNKPMLTLTIGDWQFQDSPNFFVGGGIRWYYCQWMIGNKVIDDAVAITISVAQKRTKWRVLDPILGNKIASGVILGCDEAAIEKAKNRAIEALNKWCEDNNGKGA